MQDKKIPREALIMARFRKIFWRMAKLARSFIEGDGHFGSSTWKQKALSRCIIKVMC